MDAKNPLKIAALALGGVCLFAMAFCCGFGFLGAGLKRARVESPAPAAQPELVTQADQVPEQPVEPVAVAPVVTPNPVEQAENQAPKGDLVETAFVYPDHLASMALTTMKGELHEMVVDASVRQEGDTLYLGLELDARTSEEHARHLCHRFVALCRAMAKGAQLKYIAEAKAGGRSLASVEEHADAASRRVMTPGPEFPADRIGIAIIAMWGNDTVENAFLQQNGSDLHLSVTVKSGTPMSEAERMCDGFIRLAKSFSKDGAPRKEIGAGRFNYFAETLVDGRKVAGLKKLASETQPMDW